MQIPETPNTVENLDLMLTLKNYADGKATWHEEGGELGPDAKSACLALYDNLVQFVKKVFAPLLDRVTAREMETYTMHDRTHGLKVAHLMWHILKPEARERLTPPEIGLLVCSAHLHDLGMGLSREERNARLDPASDLWERLELQESTRDAIEELRAQVGNETLPESMKRRASCRLFQAEEALLTQDTRARHATPERYHGILNAVWQMHQSDPERIPDVKVCMSFDGDSFRDKLIDICVTHNEDAEALVEADKKHSGRPRLPRDYPIGCSQADLHMVAATLRLADILDFDRERTPPALFHYLLPGSLAEPDNDSGREWGKHLAISNWHIEDDAIVFKGRCKSHIIHHAIVLFASAIEREIVGTRTTFGALQEAPWPCLLPSTVKVDIHEDGYRYVPYKFELDDDRVYSLLMGGAIYENPLDAVRELVQNAVDACKLRDALTRMYEPQAQPLTTDRILIRYEEPTEESKQPRLIVKDTGTGMDALILERYFLKVGRSYYNSTEFNRTRVDLRKCNLDFAPVSEFGIGFLSSFLIANHVEVETAMSESPRGDTIKRLLQIDGPTRLIRLSEERNEGPQRLKGTVITLYLSQGGKEKRDTAPRWKDIQEYLETVCQDLPYRLNLEHVSNGQVNKSLIDPLPLKVELPPDWEEAALRIPVDDKEAGLEGEIVLINQYAILEAEEARFQMSSVSVIGQDIVEDKEKQIYDEESQMTLLRGGFNIGSVSGFPKRYSQFYHRARLRLTWKAARNRRYWMTNLARNSASNREQVERNIIRLWLTYLLEHTSSLQGGYLAGSYGPRNFGEIKWLEKYDALRLYELASKDWHLELLKRGIEKERLQFWEESTGEALQLPYGTSVGLLNLILPRVTSLQIDDVGYNYAKPPVSDWRTVLGNCRDYITVPIGWGYFAEFINETEEILYSDGDYFNSHFRERLALFQEDEFPALRASLKILIRSFMTKQQAQLKNEEAALIRRLQNVAGELIIKPQHVNEAWRLDSFKIPDV
jgi:hypothetical protein